MNFAFFMGQLLVDNNAESQGMEACYGKYGIMVNWFSRNQEHISEQTLKQCISNALAEVAKGCYKVLKHEMRFLITAEFDRTFNRTMRFLGKPSNETSDSEYAKMREGLAGYNGYENLDKPVNKGILHMIKLLQWSVTMHASEAPYHWAGGRVLYYLKYVQTIKGEGTLARNKLDFMVILSSELEKAVFKVKEKQK